MKKTTSKAEQLRFVRNVVRELTPADLGAVAGGQKCTVTCNGKQSINCCQSGDSSPM